MIDEILEKAGFTYEQLNTAEKETLMGWMKSLQSNQLTVDMVRSFVRSLRESIVNQLIEEPEFNYIFIFKVANRKQILLKARLRNIMLIEAFLSTPEKARESLEQTLKGFADSRK